MKEYTPSIVAQVKVCGNEQTYCGHPVYAGEIFSFGNKEIAFMHTSYCSMMRHSSAFPSAVIRTVLIS